MNCTIVIASFGDQHWLDLGTQRAAQSAFAQGVPVIYVHGLTLHGARNAGLEQVATPYVSFVDADDELRPDYIRTLAAGSTDIRVPSVQYVTPGGRPKRPYVPRVPGHMHACGAACLEDGNFAVIGSMVDTDMVRSVGGFRNEEIYEDWSLFLRMYRAGATVETIPEAVYVAHVRPESRNRALPMETKNRVHREIAEAA